MNNNSSLVPQESWRPLIRVAPYFWLKYEGGTLSIRQPALLRDPSYS